MQLICLRFSSKQLLKNKCRFNNLKCTYSELVFKEIVRINVFNVNINVVSELGNIKSFVLWLTMGLQEVWRNVMVCSFCSRFYVFSSVDCFKNCSNKLKTIIKFWNHLLSVCILYCNVLTIIILIKSIQFA